MANLIILWILTLGVLIFLGIYVWKYSFPNDPPKEFLIKLFLILLLYGCYFCYLYWYQPEDTILYRYRKINLIGLFLLFFFLQLIRVILDLADRKARDGKLCFDLIKFIKNDKDISFSLRDSIKNIGDMLINFIVYFAIYVLIVYSSVREDNYDIYTYTIPGYLLSVCSILRILKYRIYDDFYKRWLYEGGSFIGSATSVATTFLQLVYNALLRAYVIIALSFACIYLFIYFSSFPINERKKFNDEYVTQVNYTYSLSFSQIGKNINKFYNTNLTALKYNRNKAFSIPNERGNLFIDFIYFSFITMSTVGYGDMLPIGSISKIICIIQVLLGYLFIGSMFALISYVISIHGKSNKS